jgi:hypothetical protein
MILNETLTSSLMLQNLLTLDFVGSERVREQQDYHSLSLLSRRLSEKKKTFSSLNHSFVYEIERVKA